MQLQWLTKLHIPFLVEMKQFMWRIGHMLLVGKVVNSVSTEIPSSRGFSSEWFKALGNTTYSIVILTWMTFKSLWMYFFASSLMLWSWLWVVMEALGDFGQTLFFWLFVLFYSRIFTQPKLVNLAIIQEICSSIFYQKALFEFYYFFWNVNREMYH